MRNSGFHWAQCGFIAIKYVIDFLIIGNIDFMFDKEVFSRGTNDWSRGFSDATNDHKGRSSLTDGTISNMSTIKKGFIGAKYVIEVVNTGSIVRFRDTVIFNYARKVISCVKLAWFSVIAVVITVNRATIQENDCHTRDNKVYFSHIFKFFYVLNLRFSVLNLRFTLITATNLQQNLLITAKNSKSTLKKTRITAKKVVI